eukprot:6492616-Amphidinium_carterae.4
MDAGDEIGEDETHEDREVLVDLFGTDDDDHDGSDDDNEAIETRERDLPEPDIESPPKTVYNQEAQILHEESGHYPKLSTCPVCQFSDGPVHQHRKLRRCEVGLLAVDLAGPLMPDRAENKYLVVGVWVGFYNHRSVSLPFVELVTSRLATEVFAAISRIVARLESLVSSVLPNISHHVPRLSGLRVIRLHTDRASEFLGKVAKEWASKNGVFATQTGAHSPESNGRAECCIRVVKSIVRRSLVSSGLETQFWGYAAKHAAELLRSYNLRKSGVWR